jgi:hypothetical protein
MLFPVSKARSQLLIVGALAALLAFLTASVPTTLHNGIKLPSSWPERRIPSQVYKTPAYITNPPAVIPIDLGRQLFVDDFLIQRTSLTRTAHRPVMYAKNPVLSPGGPDLKGLAFPYSDGVWYDPGDHLFKMWYLGSYGNMVSYAYSTDGKTWIKPSLPDAVVPGTNTVLQIGGSRDSAVVWMDLEDRNPARRFKAFALLYPPIMNVYFSPDGIHWSAPQRQTINSVSDRTTIFWNPFRKVWIESVRGSTSLPATSTAASRFSRARYYSESSDLIGWNPADPLKAFWVGPDQNDPPYSGLGGALPELYNLDAVAYESVMVGLFSWFYPGPAYDSSYDLGPDLVELGVGFSRDGFDWVRPTRGGGANAFIPASNLADTWNAYNTQSAGGGFLVVGDELWFYFSGRTLQKPATGVGSTGLAVLRRDGFYSMDAGATQALLTTRVVRFSGKYLFVNVNDLDGQLLVEVTDSTGNVVSPFSSANCVPVSVNKTLQRVAWKGVADLSGVTGRPVKLNFYLTNGSLYSFWVTPSAAGASYGYVAANGPGFAGPIDNRGATAYPTSAGTPP